MQEIASILSGSVHDLPYRARVFFEARAAREDRAVLETASHAFQWESFAQAHGVRMRERPLAQRVHGWHEGAHAHLAVAWVDLTWEGEALEVVRLAWSDAASPTSRAWVIASSMDRARAFFDAVCLWSTRSVDKEILVFDDGCFHKDAHLYAAIEGAKLSDLVLSDEMTARLRDDFVKFFTAKDLYARYGLAHKRGALFMGPPGNGKTHAIKALIRESEKPCLYVKTVISACGTDHANVRDIFERARETAPCVLVLEDIDTLVTEQNRAVFLNELDGFARNDGLLVVATTNHPERLDPALANRPSRFDRKYHFELPSLALRARYVERWCAARDRELAIDRALAQRLAEMTHGFSFAHLKELGTSALLRWLGARADFGELLLEEAASLASQIAA